MTNQIGRPDSIVRGSCVFGGGIAGIAAMVRPDLTGLFIAVMFALAFVAANYVLPASKGA